MARHTRHISSINDLTNEEISEIFGEAQGFLENLADQVAPYRIARSSGVAQGKVLATLFYEPSTRTRLSFESAMLRLGGQVISMADSSVSSAAKGESLADTVRVISNYADLIVLRHPRDGAARLAADYSPVPIINGGDGSHEHPTQTLCDVFTLQKRNTSLKNLHVAISGDLRGSRTVHSLVYALARFGARLKLLPAKGLELPPHVYRRLRDELNCDLQETEDLSALYVTAPDRLRGPSAPQSSLFPESVDIHFHFNNRVDAVYVTRFQRERANKLEEDKYPTVDAKFLREKKYSKASVMHPLPRVGELDQALDSDKRAAYFEQAAYGVPIRMALISSLLGLQSGHSLKRFDGGFRPLKATIVDQRLDAGATCKNTNCIVHDPIERPYVRSKFQLLWSPTGAGMLRCMYCEMDIESFVVADTTSRLYSPPHLGLSAMTAKQLRRFVFFENEAAARAHEFSAGDAIGTAG